MEGDVKQLFLGVLVRMNAPCRVIIRISIELNAVRHTKYACVGE